MGGYILYRKGYKYQLHEDYHIRVGIPGDVETAWLKLKDGILTIHFGYAWDGPTMSIDTSSFMRGSLVHDALYQLIRLGLIDPAYRKMADDLLYTICREDGMLLIRAYYVWLAVRAFALESSHSHSERPVLIAP